MTKVPLLNAGQALNSGVGSDEATPANKAVRVPKAQEGHLIPVTLIWE